MLSLNGQDDAFAGLVAAKQFKQALNLCEKKLKKSKNDEYLQAKKITILVLWPDEARRVQGAKELDTLLSRKPPLSNVDALGELESVVKNLEISSKVQQLWLRAAASRPNDEKLHKMWFWAKFTINYLDDAQQAAFQWRKNFPEQRPPHFLYILVTHLVSQQQAKNDTNKQVQRSLAYQSLKKSIDATQGKGLGKSAWAIATSEDLSLLVRIYREQGRYKEAFQFLDSMMNSTFRPGKENWEHSRQFIELASLTQHWKALWEFCLGVLQDARRALKEPSNTSSHWGKLGDDWKAWDGLVEASSELGTSEILGATESFINDFQAENLNSRNAYLALIKFYILETSAGRGDQGHLVAAFREYLLKFSCKVICFQDIHPYLSYLTAQRHMELLKFAAEVSRDERSRSCTSEASIASCFGRSLADIPTKAKTVKWLTREINALKLDYNLVVSRNDDSLPPNLLPLFINNCLRLYHLSLHIGLDLPVSDRRPGDDAALLAAMGLIRLYNRDEGKSYANNIALFRSIVILENILSNSKHNYDALLLLVRLYMYFGAGSLAIERYSRLSIKNMQHATISWALFAHMSKIHPQPTKFSSADGKSQTITNPLEEIAQILQWHYTADALSTKSLNTMQENGLWNMCLDAFSTKLSISQNFIRHQLFVEGKRMQRLNASPQDVKIQAKVNIPPRTIDTMDKAAFPSFEAGSQPPFYNTIPAPSPAKLDDKWLVQEFRISLLWDLLHDGSSLIDGCQLEAMAEESGFLQGDNSESEPSLAVYALERLYQCYHDTTTRNITEYMERLLNCVERFLRVVQARDISHMRGRSVAPFALDPDLCLPTWNTFHAQYTVLEICQITVLSVNHMLAENKKKSLLDQAWLRTKAQGLLDLCKAFSDEVRNAARDLQESIQGSTATQEISKRVLAGSVNEESRDAVGEQLWALGIEANVKVVCKTLQESWSEGLDGVLKTRFI